MPPSVQRPKLSVSFSSSRPPKLLVSITINHLVNFGLITVEPNILESFVRYHHPFWIIHNVASEIFPLMISNENDFQWDLLQPPLFNYLRGCWCVCEPEKNIKTVVHWNIWLSENGMYNLSLTWDFPHLFDNSKNVRRYRDGLINL